MPVIPPQGARWLSAALPAVAAVLLHGWAAWYFGAASPPPAAVAVAGAGILGAGALVAYFLLVGGNGAVFGTLLLAVGLLLTVAAADRTAAREEVATCVVREVHTRSEGSFGEGGPPPKTVYRFALDCPGGHPAELKDDRSLAPVGGQVRVAYDPLRRTAPAVAGEETSPWTPALWGALALALSTLIAASRPHPGRTPAERPDA
ncbi:hypothetical protein [Streptomyces sp. NPDC090022]|uniref:hypothetical protein n=1 Tax=Streptomyces sp. NPDC090022 TaxID=3365920 RepID=UPI0037F17274